MLNPWMELGMYIYKQELGQSQIIQDNKEMSVKSLVQGHKKRAYRSRKAAYLRGKVETKGKKILGVLELRRNSGEEMSNSELGGCCYTTHARRALSSSL